MPSSFALVASALITAWVDAVSLDSWSSVPSREKYLRLLGHPVTEPVQDRYRVNPLTKRATGAFRQDEFDSLIRPYRPADWSSPFSAHGLTASWQSGTVRNIQVAGEKVHVGGQFTGAEDVPARWSAVWAGSRWSGFDKPCPYFLEQANDMLVDGEKVYFAGGIDSLDVRMKAVPSTRSNVVVWDGDSWSRISIDTANEATALAVWEGKVLVGIGGSGVWSLGDGQPVAFGHRVRGTITRLEALEGNLYLAGHFMLEGEDVGEMDGLAKWEAGDWKRLAAPVGPIRDLAIKDGSLFVLKLKTVSSDHEFGSQSVLTWNGSGWSEVESDAAGAAMVALETNSQGLFLVSADEYETSPETQVGIRISKWNGNRFQTVESREFRGWIYEVEATPTGLILGGRFQGVGSLRADNLVRWESGQWKSFSSGKGTGPSNLALMHSDGKRLFFANGALRFAGGLPTHCATAWDGNGWEGFGSRLRKRKTRSRDTELFGNTDADIAAMTVWNGQLVLGGQFDSTENGGVRNVARWDGKTWAPLGDGYPGKVRALLAEPDRILVGGSWITDRNVPGHNNGPFQGNTVAAWTGTEWQVLDGLKANVLKLVRFRGEILALAEGADGKGEVMSWDGSLWRRPIPQSSGSDIADMILHEEKLILLSDWVCGWNGISLDTLAREVTSARMLASDGSNLFVSAQMAVPGAENSILARWDGKAWHPLEIGDPRAAPGILTVHGDYLYMFSLLPSINGSATLWGYARWHRMTGTWSRPAARRKAVRDAKLKYQLVGTGFPEGAFFEQEIFDLSGRRLVERRIPAGVNAARSPRVKD